jgi:hypothetical protein
VISGGGGGGRSSHDHLHRLQSISTEEAHHFRNAPQVAVLHLCTVHSRIHHLNSNARITRAYSVDPSAIPTQPRLLALRDSTTNVLTWETSDLFPILLVDLGVPRILGRKFHLVMDTRMNSWSRINAWTTRTAEAGRTSCRL